MYSNEVIDDVLDVELDDALGYERQQLQWWTDDQGIKYERYALFI